MLVAFVLLYLAVSVGIGLWAARRVKNSKDFLVAGRSLPLFMSVTVVFATWFGAETVLAVSSTFVKEGLRGIVADPFGFSMCLLFVGLFFARAFYRMDLLTIGDFYRKRYGRPVELATSLAITVSYLGWTSAQMAALGVVFHTVSGGAITMPAGIALGAGCVLVYTLFGGMWSVAFTDLFQSVVIVLGLTYLAFLVADMAGGPGAVIAHAATAEKLDFWPKLEARDMLAFFAAWLTAAVGSIPQQDIFQRVTAAKDEQTAVRGSIIGGALYFCFAFVPIFLGYSALLIDPQMVAPLLASEGTEFQLILPKLILERTPLFAQVLFFGALLSAILSTASGALLAPTALFTENVLRALRPGMGDRQFLLTLRLVLVIFTLAVMLFALESEATIYQMVQNTYKVTLVSCLVPLAAGIYWQRATAQGALLSFALGLVTWTGMELFAADSPWPAQLVGFAFALAGMWLGSIASPPPHLHQPTHHVPHSAAHHRPPRVR
ncbi:MAG: sodium:solute symporter family protein [Burkholderiales bacterium]|nr:sodium:solute symporter family protein [Burkholderiales bacterium]